MNVIWRGQVLEGRARTGGRHLIGAALIVLLVCVFLVIGRATGAVAARTVAHDRVLTVDGNRRLKLVDLDALEARTIAPSVVFESAALSPDGSEIVANRIGKAGLVLIDAGTGAMKRLTSGDDRDPTWSPDGSWIAFARGEGQSPLKGQGLFKVRPNGSGLRLVEAGVVSTPAWSPSGGLIAFDSWAVRGWDKTNQQWLHTRTSLELVTPAGRGLRHLTSHDWLLERTGVDDAMPIWAPNSASLVFQRTVGAGDSAGSSIYEIKSSGTGLRRVTSPAYFAEPTGWSPDGREIAGWQSKICKACSSNGPIEALVTDLASGTRPGFAAYTSVAWSPTGKLVAFGCTTAASGACVVGDDGAVVQPISVGTR